MEVIEAGRVVSQSGAGSVVVSGSFRLIFIRAW